MRPSPNPVDPLSALNPPETVVVDSHRVWCDGDGAAGFVECGYCDRRFVAAHAQKNGSGAPHADEDEALAPAAYEGAATATN